MIFKMIAYSRELLVLILILLLFILFPKIVHNILRIILKNSLACMYVQL